MVPTIAELVKSAMALIVKNRRIIPSYVPEQALADEVMRPVVLMHK